MATMQKEAISARASDNLTAHRIELSTSPVNCDSDAIREDAGSEVTLPQHIAETETENEIAMKKLFSKLKSEEMFELRKLKHHQKPVSEFSSKQQLEQILVTKCKLPPPDDQAVGASPEINGASGGNSLTHSRVKEFDSIAQAVQTQSPQDLRPESIQLEIRGLFERRVVTGMLQSPVQAELERVVLEQQQRQRRPRRRRARPPPQSQQREAQGAGAAGRLMAAIRSGSRSRGASYQRRARAFRPPADGNYPMPRRDQSRILDHLRQSPALNSLDQEAREEIVSEVSNLVHQQLVTSALSGEFRGVLEFHIQERINHTSDGAARENFLQSHRSSRSNSQSPVNNDRAEGYASNSEVQREMSEMKTQLAELKQMMRVSFDLQMDIQRSIRQEVAAALSMFLASSPPQVIVSSSGHPTSGQQGTAARASVQPCPIPTLRQEPAFGSRASTQSDGGRVIEAGHCVICSDGVIDSVVYRCGHMCVCMACGLELKSQHLKCPICRAPITDIIRAYASMM